VQVNDDDACFEALDGWLPGHGCKRVIVESTGRHHWRVHRWLHDRGQAGSVANPPRPRHFTMSVGLLAKTNRNDGEMLTGLVLARKTISQAVGEAVGEVVGTPSKHEARRSVYWLKGCVAVFTASENDSSWQSPSIS